MRLGTSIVQRHQKIWTVIVDCYGFETKMMGMSGGAQSVGEGYDKGQDIGLNKVIARKNTHPTVKPVELMRYLVRLVTPKGGVGVRSVHG